MSPFIRFFQNKEPFPSENDIIIALVIKENFYGKNHNEVSMTINNLGLVYAKLHQYDKACKLYLKALCIKEQYFGDSHPDVALFLFNLGTWFVGLCQSCCCCY